MKVNVADLGTAINDELKAWLEFYKELGIEGFYCRGAGKAQISRRVSPASNLKPPLPRTQSPGAPSSSARPQVPDRSGVWPSSSNSAVSEHKAASPTYGSRAPYARQTPGTPTQPPATIPVSSRPTPDVLQARPTSNFEPVVRPPAASFSLFDAPPAIRSGPETLEQIRQDLGDCRRCKLAPTRKTIVFGQGNPHAELVLIGEGPGADEDEQGLPFVGRAGKLLNRIIQMVGFKREEVYICNIVKCRPPENRVPEKDEIETCSPFLYRQIEAIKPRLICCLGAPSARTVLGIKEGITRVRGQFMNFGSTKALATVHPAYVLRNPREEKILREDFEKIRDFLKGQ